MKKYLVTGGAGFIGSNITEKLLQKGESVRVVDNLSTGKKENMKDFFDNPNFEFIEGDLTDLEVAKRAVSGVNFVLHQAAIPSVQRSVDDPLKSNSANVTGTLNLLIAARDEKVEKFVYAASSSAYGDNPELPKREDLPVMPISPYALTKYVGEKYCQIFWRIYGLPTISLRYFNVFGPKQDPESQYAAVIPRFIKSLLNGSRPVVYGTGEQSRDFTFVENVVDANLAGAESKNGFGEVFNVGCGTQISLNDLLASLKNLIGSKVEPDYQEARQGDVLHTRADISKIKKVLGYEPMTSFEQGLVKTIEWYKKNEKKN